MSKYDKLWKWISENGEDSFKLTHERISEIAGFPIDHSFLRYQKELPEYGFKVVKISMKDKTVTFERIKQE
ncbi:MAG: hypothetical protein IKS74_04410 [Methanomicrobium sp.]|nr:hypothetical protein [Methanomicrobium sp.]